MDDKRQRITQSAIKAFQEKGIEKTTVSEIVKGAGVAQGTFYLYFSSKLSVMPAIAAVLVEKSINRLTINVQQDKPFSIQLQQTIDTIFSLTEQYHDILALIYAGMASTEHLKEWEAIYEPYYTYIASLLKNSINNGELCVQIHPERMAVLLIGLIESAADQSYLYDSQSKDKIELKKKDVFQFITKALTTS